MAYLRFVGNFKTTMKTTTAFLFAFGIIVLSSCKKLDESVQGYFFVQNVGNEEYTLYINDREIGVLEESPVIPLICIDSTLMSTTTYTMDLKRNAYEVKNSNNEIVAQGLFRLRNNGMTGRSSKDLGAMYMNSTKNTLIVGFNTEEVDHEYINQCALN